MTQCRDTQAKTTPARLLRVDPALMAIAEPIIEQVAYWISTGVRAQDVAASLGIEESGDKWPVIQMFLALGSAHDAEITLKGCERNRLLQLFFSTLPNGG